MSDSTNDTMGTFFAVFCLLFLLVFGWICGCGAAKPEYSGYFYIAPADGQYRVMETLKGCPEDVPISKPLSLAQATALADKLNADVSGNLEDAK